MTENLANHEHPSDHCKLFFNGRYMKRWNLAIIISACVVIGGLLFYSYHIESGAQMKISEKNAQTSKENADDIKEVESAIKVLKANFDNFEGNQQKMLVQLENLDKHLLRLLNKKDREDYPN